MIDLGVRSTPLERWHVDGVSLLVKRDDLSAPALGGNKVRALEYLLDVGPVRPAPTVLTVGATGSTHALAVATYAARLGLRTEVITWPQEEHAVAVATARALAGVARVTHAGSVTEAYARATLRRLRRGVHWIPAGGSVPLGALGHVRAGIELAAQLEPGVTPLLVAPLGSGGTIAGLMAGLAVAGRPLTVVGVQVVPRVVARRGRVVRLARRAAALWVRRTGDAEPPPRIEASRLRVWRGAYGGAYGRETDAARTAAVAFARAGGPALEPTYSAKAFAVALELARASPGAPVLFWLTFDGRWMERRSQSLSRSVARRDRPVPPGD